ncbi:MAG TPA: ribokinase [Acidimicrobiia bacterium]|nr:ribokinase [Acidimicrobiia bacterium]
MIAVVGSVNRDLVLHVGHHPVPGETVLGLGHETMPGGKGANQAVAAARLGGDVAFVGRVGADDAGKTLIEEFLHEGVDTAHLVMDAHAPTGLAVITVDDTGENTIVVSSGANGRVSPDDVNGAAALLMAATVTLLQLEIPIPTVVAAARSSAGIVVLNAAPGADLPDALLDAVDVLVVNSGELEALTGSDDPISARSLPVPVTVVTLGAGGARVIRSDSDMAVASPRVSVVDATGAGDTFCGALAVGLDEGSSLEAAVRRAVVAGALSVTAAGARSGMPTAATLEAALRTQGS